MALLSDLSLVTQVAVFGNRRAFDKLVVKYQSPVRRFFLHLTGGDSQLSDDLAQDTFIKAYTHIGQFRGTSSFSTWLMRIAYNVFYDYKRKNLPQTDSREVALDAHSSIVRGEGAGMRLDIHTALAILKQEERMCITLQQIDGYAIDEIATITGMPTGTVKSHLSRGKEKLVNYLKQNGYERK